MKGTVLIVSLLFCVATSTIIYSNTACVSDNLDPCKTHPRFERSVWCENINDMKTFIRVLRCSSKRNMQEVFLEKSSLDFLPLYILDFCGFIFLNVKSVTLSKLLEGNVLIRLEQLKLDNVLFRDTWSWEPLSVLRHLLKFSVANMEITHLDGSLLDHLNENLRSLTLDFTNTNTIGPEAFTKFTELEYLSLENNHISELDRGMFPVPSKIKYLHLGKNKLTSLSDDFFEEMPYLERVGIEGNFISEIHSRTFEPIWNNLDTLLLDGNPLKCHCKLLWLAKKKSPTVFTGECFAPKIKYGKELKSLTSNDFRCFLKR